MKIKNYKILIHFIFTIVIILSISGCIDNQKEISEPPDANCVINKMTNKEYSSIQDAIDNASNGDDIYIKNGIYKENIILYKQLSLIGESREKTIISFDESMISEEKQNEPTLILILHPNCTIKYLNLQNSIKNHFINGVSIATDNNTIENLTISNMDYGILFDIDPEISFSLSEYDFIYDSEQWPVLRNNTIRHNKLENNIFSTFIVKAENTICKNNIFSQNKKFGVYIFGEGQNEIAYNEFYDNDIAIRIKSSKSNSVHSNLIWNNTIGAYLCCGTSNNTIYNNAFLNNTNVNAFDNTKNNWNNETGGNYWDDYSLQYTNSASNNGIYNRPYAIASGETNDNVSNNYDWFPLVNNPFSI